MSLTKLEFLLSIIEKLIYHALIIEITLSFVISDILHKNQNVTSLPCYLLGAMNEIHSRLNYFL